MTQPCPACGDAAARQHHLRQARRLFTEMGVTGHADRIESPLRRSLGVAR